VFSNQIQHLVQQINAILHQLTNEEYCRPLSIFNQSTIGQHTRHIIEFFYELEKGYAQGVVNYGNRKRNKLIETDKNAAMAALNNILGVCEKPDKLLQLAINHEPLHASDAVIATTYYRELAFAMEHTLHHMAIMRIGFEQFKTIVVPKNFGFAAATLRQQIKCAL
jgi:hypothetical protein